MAPSIARLGVEAADYRAVVALHEIQDVVCSGYVLAEVLGVPATVLWNLLSMVIQRDLKTF